MSSRPQTISEVLCRELGANHPDGALQQIRTMKRVLRSHYRAQKRLESFGVNGVGDAVTHITALRSRIDTLRTRQKQRARANVAAADAALDALAEARERLRAKARPWDSVAADSTGARPPGADDASADDASAEDDAARDAAQGADSVRPEASRPGPPESAEGTAPQHEPAAPDAAAASPSLSSSDSPLDIVATVQAELEELRLELWVERARPPEGDGSGRTFTQEAPEDRTLASGPDATLAPPLNADALASLLNHVADLRRATRTLRENEQRHREAAERLREENRHLEARVETLEHQLRHQRSRLQVLMQRFVQSDTVDA